MTADKKPAKRVRQSAESVGLYGKNKRQNWRTYEPVYQRWRYLCDLLFSGDYRQMAAAIDTPSCNLKRVMFRHSHLTIRLAAHIVGKLGVSAEWLLCGSGPMFQTQPEDANHFVLPMKLQPLFPALDGVEFCDGVEFLSSPPHVPTITTPPEAPVVLSAARALYEAGAANKPVGMFLSAAAFACRPVQTVWPFFAEHYASFAVTTLSGACADAVAAAAPSHFDVNAIARTAAMRGVGYGEVFVNELHRDAAMAEQSLLVHVATSGAPVFIATDFGEIGRHTAPSTRGAETGAAIGAATYVDLLSLTAQLKNFFGQPGGAAVIVGEAVRGVRLFLERFAALKLLAPFQIGFTFVIFSRPDPSLESLVRRSGGRAIFLEEPTADSFTQLFAACRDVYAGKVPYDQD
jgi:hypothetical protein